MERDARDYEEGEFENRSKGGGLWILFDKERDLGIKGLF